MLFSIVLLIYFFGLVRSLKCPVTNDTCKIEFKFDEPLAGDPKWSQKCLTLMEERFCQSVVVINYVTQVTKVRLYGPTYLIRQFPFNESTLTVHQLSIDFLQNMTVDVTVIVICNTKDMCATEIIQSLIPKFNTMKGRSLDIYSALKALLIDPSAQSSDKKGDISCFQSTTNTTAQCTDKDDRACTIVESKSSVVASCTNRTERQLSIGYSQQFISEKPKPVEPYSVVYCDRDNCNGPAVQKRARELTDKFLEGTYVSKATHLSNAGHRSSSIVGIGLFFLVLPTIAFQYQLRCNVFH